MKPSLDQKSPYRFGKGFLGLMNEMNVMVIFPAILIASRPLPPIFRHLTLNSATRALNKVN
ncbi:hypothetical protein CYL31_14955 [Marinomonas sp. A3A]|nr:hypothetical protein CYL31_14955 [Marinomonas sp. A3A]